MQVTPIKNQSQINLSHIVINQGVKILRGSVFEVLLLFSQTEIKLTLV